MYKTTIYLPENTHKRIGRVAKRMGKSRAEITRSALDDYLDRNERVADLPWLGIASNPNAPAAEYKERLAKYWGRRR